MTWSVIIIIAISIVIDLVLLLFLTIFIFDIWIFRSYIPHWQRVKHRMLRRSKLTVIKGDKDSKGE